MLQPWPLDFKVKFVACAILSIYTKINRISIFVVNQMNSLCSDRYLKEWKLDNEDVGLV